MFYSEFSQFGSAIALRDPNRAVSYDELAEQCDGLNHTLGEMRQFLMIRAHNSIATVVAYLSGLRGQHVCMLVDPALPDVRWQALLEAFQPNVVMDEGDMTRLHHRALSMDVRLALLMPTSGSTGAVKHVALSYDNLESNTQSICAYLPIERQDRTISSLPLHYAYGLSILNTHLACGAEVVFTPFDVLSRDFWTLFKAHKITSLAGVPYTYEMLNRLRFTRMSLPSLRYFTQAGGKLPARIVEELAQFASESDKQFFVMYGQTEATARIAYTDQDTLADKPHVIGKTIPEGRLWLEDDQGNSIDQVGESGEIVYRGGNVMLGYAQNATDLTHFDASDTLHTGDLGAMDEQGDFFITGRKSRFVKVFGKRIGLDELEQVLFEHNIHSYCCGSDNQIVVAVAKDSSFEPSEQWLSDLLRVHHSVLHVMAMDALPVTASGKKDYQAVMSLWRTQAE